MLFTCILVWFAVCYSCFTSSATSTTLWSTATAASGSSW